MFNLYSIQMDQNIFLLIIFEIFSTYSHWYHSQSDQSWARSKSAAQPALTTNIRLGILLTWTQLFNYTLSIYDYQLCDLLERIPRLPPNTGLYIIILLSVLTTAGSDSDWPGLACPRTGAERGKYRGHWEHQLAAAQGRHKLLVGSGGWQAGVGQYNE